MYFSEAGDATEYIYMDHYIHVRTQLDKSIEHLHYLWDKAYDREGDGEVTLEELNDPNVKEILKITTEEELAEHFSQVDRN